MEKIALNEDVFTIEGFFTPEECAAYIRQSEAIGYEEAMVQVHGKQVMMKNIRDNSRVLFKDEALAELIFEKIRAFCPQEIDNTKLLGLNELFRFYKYEPGQKFKKHRDGSYQRNEAEFSQLTLLIYLNDDFEGGATSFRGFELKPKTGTALVFRHAVIHQGDELISGIKYVLRTDIMYKYNDALF